MSGEWTTILGLAGIMLAMLLVYGGVLLWNRRKRKQKILRSIREDWGAWPSREYDYYDWEAVQGYFNNKECNAFQIDDITWEDLDLSRVFMLINHTASFLGEGYLYYLLRTPSFDESELQERERLITYFQEHQEEREKLQTFYYETGKAGRNSIFDAVYTLAQVHPVNNLHHYGVIAGMAASVAVLLLEPTPGILLVIMAMCFAMLDYYKMKRPIEKYIISCRFLLKTLDSAREMAKLEIPEIRPYQEAISKAARSFGRLKRNTFFLMNGSRSDGDLLTGIILYLNSCFHIDLIQFSTVVKEMKKHIPEFEILVENMGKIEAMISIASFRQCMEAYCVPQLEVSGNTVFLEAEQLYHPLIQEAVKNSIHTRRNVLLTGSNASGKSTFLKTVAVNAVLAQTVHTCMADSWKAPCFRVFSSMALQDNLEGQESYYIVEIKSLKRILDAVPEQRPPVLCFVDEVLRGTNTVERVAASSQVLRYMMGKPVLCFAATHDIELTHILEQYYENYHFQETVEENDVRFDYRLYQGRATSRNAIRLLKVMGYAPEIIEQAEYMAENFLKTGEWASS